MSDRDMMPELALLACPFCGRPPEPQPDGLRAWHGRMSIHEDCPAKSITIWVRDAQSVAAWNRRSTTDREAAIREALEKIIAIVAASPVSDHDIIEIPEIARAALSTLEEKKSGNGS